MLKPVNLLSIHDAKTSLPKVIFESYLKKSEIIAKDSEIDDLCSFVELVYSNTSNIRLFDSFYFGYEIKQISKEFDLLRFGEKFIVNVELKRKQTIEKIKKQLIQNRYYLNFLGKPVLNFTYVTEENKIYFLNTEETGEQSVIEVSIDYLIRCLSEQEITQVDNIDKLFNPTNYLVSPFNSTQRFVEGEYFLTQQQSEIREYILKNLNEEEYCYGIKGSAGTGKTLLTYDIAMHFISQNKKVLIVHCGNINQGHWKLKADYSWEICAAKNLKDQDLYSYDLIIVDETQRIWQEQFDILVEAINNSKLRCIFSYDANQCLADWEIVRNIPNQIESRIPSKIFELTGKIRTNPEVASFIKNVFDLSKRNDYIEYSNIEIQYFTSYDDAGSFATLLKEKQWEVISYTLSQFNRRKTDKFTSYADFNAHDVVGQEFDKVATVIDSSFRYNEDKRLTAVGKYYYSPVQMLFQMLSRAREQICIIIVDNEELLTHCLDILGHIDSPSIEEYQEIRKEKNVVQSNSL